MTNSRIALIVLAALAVPFAARAAVDPPVPCEETDGDAFREIGAGGPMHVLDVGDVVKEKGKNLCSVLIDTTMGRLQLFFTSSRSVNGVPMWKKVSVKAVPD